MLLCPSCAYGRLLLFGQSVRWLFWWSEYVCPPNLSPRSHNQAPQGFSKRAEAGANRLTQQYMYHLIYGRGAFSLMRETARNRSRAFQSEP